MKEPFPGRSQVPPRRSPPAPLPVPQPKWRRALCEAQDERRDPSA